MNDPNLCLLLESAEAVTLTLMMTSIVSYGAQLATKTTLASVQGLISAIQYGLGQYYQSVSLQSFNGKIFK